MGWIVNNGVSMIDCRWNLKKESFDGINLIVNYLLNNKRE